MSDRVGYVYGIVSAPAWASREGDAAAPTGAPAGLDGAPVEVLSEGDLAALVSWLPAATYDRARVEALAGDVAWIGGRAVAHDAVVTWASERGGVVPVPMFALYSGPDAVRAMLAGRAAELRAVLARVAHGEEYGVRLFVREEQLAGALGSLSPRLAALERQEHDATPGQRYLLGRKLESERTAEGRRIAREVAAELYDTLTPIAMGAVREPVPRSEDGGASLAALNAYFLVRRGETEPFARALTEFGARWEPRGFRVEFTGPWPPYHFVGARA